MKTSTEYLSTKGTRFSLSMSTRDTCSFVDTAVGADATYAGSLSSTVNADLFPTPQLPQYFSQLSVDKIIYEEAFRYNPGGGPPLLPRRALFVAQFTGATPAGYSSNVGVATITDIDGYCSANSKWHIQIAQTNDTTTSQWSFSNFSATLPLTYNMPENNIFPGETNFLIGEMITDGEAAVEGAFLTENVSYASAVPGVGTFTAAAGPTPATWTFIGPKNASATFLLLNPGQ